MATFIRAAVPSDAPAVAQLTTQLGYPVDAETIAGRLARLGRRPDHLVIVAVLNNKIVGWLHAHASDMLESGFRTEIAGLVVSETCRRRGVGRDLVRHFEHWSRGMGADAVIVRSNIKRTESHIFYPALGFSLSKTQAVYRKPLERAEPG